MTQNTISLNEKAYNLLKKRKKEKETYSDIIIRLCTTQDQKSEEDFLLKYIGAFKDDQEHWDDIENQIRKHRNSHFITEEH